MARGATSAVSKLGDPRKGLSDSSTAHEESYWGMTEGNEGVMKNPTHTE